MSCLHKWIFAIYNAPSENKRKSDTILYFIEKINKVLIISYNPTAGKRTVEYQMKRILLIGKKLNRYDNVQ